MLFRSKEYVEDQLNAGKDVILEIEVQGAFHVRELFPDALLLFITPPNAIELKNRLVNRGTESLDKIEQRLSRASEESIYMKESDYIVVNDDLDECVDRLNEIIENEHSRTMRSYNFIEKMNDELKAFKKGDH